MTTRVWGILGLVFWLNSFAAADSFDLLVRNGRIVDGTGAPWYTADVGVAAGKIVKIGRLADAKADRTIDATGLVVAPGFIDMMGQTATPTLDHPDAAYNLLTQGVTTILAGEGGSAAPLDPKSAGNSRWTTMAEYFALLEKSGIPLNVAQNVGHTQVREIVPGKRDREPTPAELQRMRQLVRESMEAGAVGLSTALIYPPATYATTREIVELAKVAGQYGGRYYTHMRNEGDQLLEAIEEALQIGRLAQTPVHIFHLKAAGKQNWGKMELAIARIKAARAEGQPVAADVYPYVNNGLSLRSFVHPRHFARGDAEYRRKLDDPQWQSEVRREMESQPGGENWYRNVGYDWRQVVLGRMQSPPYLQHNGKSLAEVAKALGSNPWDVFFGLLKTCAFAMPQSMSEANKIQAIQQEFVSFCTDVGSASAEEVAHPRGFGAFPRILAYYCRRLNVAPLERIVARMTAVAANEIMAYDRGRIAQGLAADLVLFDYERIEDKATFAQPAAVSSGVKYVLVNGVVVLESGRYTGAKPGKVLRGPGYRPAKP